MRMSKIMKLVVTLTLVGAMAIGVTGCNKANTSNSESPSVKTEQTQKETLKISIENAITITQPFSHLLTLEGVPTDSTGMNTYIIPEGITPRINVSAQSNTDLSKLINGKDSIYEVYNNSILIKDLKENCTEVKTKDGEMIKFYKVNFESNEYSSNTIYLIKKSINDFITPAELERLKKEEEKLEEKTEQIESETENKEEETTEEK